MEERMEKEAGRAGAAEQTSAGKALVQADEHRIFMRKNYAFFGGASALYALFYTFCLYRNASGITWPFFRGRNPCLFLLMYQKVRGSMEKRQHFLSGQHPSSGHQHFLTDNIAIHNVTKLGIFLLAVSMMLHQYLIDRRWNLSKYLLSLGQALLETVASLGYPVSDGNAWMKERERDGKNAKGRYVLLGILILCPLLVVILALLASADLVFRELFIHLFDNVEPIDIFMVCFMLVTMFFASYSFIAMLNRRVIKEECADKRKQEPVLAITVTSVPGFCLPDFLWDPDRLSVSAQIRASGRPVLCLLCQTGILSAACGLRDQSGYRADLPFSFPGEPGPEGDSCGDFPVHLLHGGIKRLPDASVH